MAAACVLVVDGDVESRSRIEVLIGRTGLVAVGAETGSEALELARREAPALVILETALPDIDGYMVCRELRELYGEAMPILFLTSSRLDSHDVVAGLLVGGDDYIVKPFDPAELLARVRRHLACTAAARGTQPFSPSESFGLTARELEILQRLAEGCGPQQIARDFVISPKTVASHIQRTLAKMHVHSRLQAVALAYESGLITRPDIAV